MTRARLKNGLITLYRGDAYKIAPRLRRRFDALITDPPYGIAYNNDFTRFSGGRHANGEHRQAGHHSVIRGDDRPFDPTPWLAYPRVVLFGSNCFSDRLPLGSLFVWVKRRPNAIGKFCGDCEVAWYNRGHGVHLFHHVWSGHDRETERGPSLHPHQKPVALFDWVLSRLRGVRSVLDPFAGTSPIGEACAARGISYVGIESEDAYFDRAVERIKAA